MNVTVPVVGLGDSENVRQDFLAGASKKMSVCIRKHNGAYLEKNATLNGEPIQDS